MSKKQKLFIKGGLVTDKPTMFEEALSRLLDLYCYNKEEWEVDITYPAEPKNSNKNATVQCGKGKKKN